MSDDLARQLEDLRREVDGMRGDVRSARGWQRSVERNALLSRLASGPESRHLSMASLREPAIGQAPSYDTLGNVQPWFGQTNLLIDPTFESLPLSRFIQTTATLANKWQAHYVLNSGTAPASRFVQPIARGLPNTNPFNSGLAVLNTYDFGTNAANVDIYLYPVTDFAPAVNALPWLVAAVRPLVNVAVSATIDVATVTLQIYNVTTSTVEATSEAFDVKGSALWTSRQLVAAVTHTQAEFRANVWRWRAVVHIEKPASTEGTALISLGEPQLHFSYTPDPAPYTPAVAGWSPTVLAGTVAYTSALTPAQITANTGTWNPTGLDGSATVRVTTDASRTVAGLPGGTEGREILLENVGSFDLVLNHEDSFGGATSAVNRFALPGAVALTIKPGEGVLVRYDATSARWRAVAQPSSPAGTFTGAFSLTGVISPAQLTANVNDWAPTGFATCSVIRISTDANRTITGIAGGADGRMLLIHNVGSFNMTIANESANSAAANRILCPSASNLLLGPQGSAWLRYDGTSLFWRLVGI